MMKRRDFLKITATLGAGLGLGFTTIKKWYEDESESLDLADLPAVSGQLKADMDQLMKWLKENGWTSYLQQQLGVNLETTGDDLKRELIKPLEAGKLTKLLANTQSGYDDFSGERLIQPGFPAYSLLFHTLASPRVRPASVKSYPSLPQIDLLENYIYALSDWQQLKSIYKINSDADLVLAVFACEYRPAFKTPHHSHADMVYSRTGIGRIGEQPMNYDALNRCHTNKPADATLAKSVAVIPARYALYIAMKVKHSDISLVKTGHQKGNDSKDDRNDSSKTFLQPIRKLFNQDVLTRSAKLRFKEAHKTEKLNKLAARKVVKFLDDLKPQQRLSPELLVQDAAVSEVGSSFLTVSRPQPLIRPAKEKGRQLFFYVPPYKVIGEYENRYFTALATQEVEDVELLQGNHPIARIYNDYQSPRNQPMFVNITNKKNGTNYLPLVKDKSAAFEIVTTKGGYYAPLFEDSICDGSVTIDITELNLETLAGINRQVLPAFSIITAPDFFPQIDPLDLLAYDIAPGFSEESSFYEGGVASLATARIKPNPKMINSSADLAADTYLAVLSAPLKSAGHISSGRLHEYKNPAIERDYEISGYLPDVASSVFAPGWDVTYCKLENDKDIYIGTEGLGSPFIEDMKFCSALNGMWPATSPDASRTFQGGNERNYRNPTAIPLLDQEIGISGDGPAGKENECWGWDGEQGPFLEKISGNWKVNFTDLGRADAVSNALRGKLDMSQLRKLKSHEFIARMECLKTCIHTLRKINFRDEFKENIVGYSYLWLVSAEQVNWGKENAKALGIPTALSGKDKGWITDKSNARVKGDGYLFVFVNSARDSDTKREWAPDFKRRRLDCILPVYVCQVTNAASAEKKIAWAEINNKGNITWH